MSRTCYPMYAIEAVIDVHERSPTLAIAPNLDLGNRRRQRLILGVEVLAELLGIGLPRDAIRRIERVDCWWVMSTKREETRIKRLGILIEAAKMKSG